MLTVYWICATVGGTLLVAQLALSLLGLGGDEGEFEVDVHPADGWFVGMLSLRAITGGVTFFGLGGLAGDAATFGATQTLLIAAASGLVAIYLVVTMTGWLKGLQSEGTARIEGSVGKIATVYLPIPRDRSGHGKVTLTLQNRTVEYAAQTSHDDALPTGSKVIVTGVIGQDTVEVMPEQPPSEETPHA